MAKATVHCLRAVSIVVVVAAAADDADDCHQFQPEPSTCAAVICFK